ncbi:NodA family N-acyltransferase [Sinorhizobium saheli]|uniref:Nodulation protein A n=3 Tax=Sinorhizobium TaxID=28105 RepID=A0A178Y0B6_SINSA|nr:NodA family N-acyltransferase [Sinorhizobium saheli]MQW86680.1 NodA family N-acyltransferase [Sinorhizobium saheli]OAP40175.1 acyltransferase [Sinorhizobium saheli]CAC82829.1 NodA protein [Sinorhizobium saheli bv. sesbaniae]CAC82831.1 NodA protein [Sinorhizobium terangae bv. sesbaniae]
MSSDVRWKICWETDLQVDDHAELSAFFRNTYGPTGAFNAQPFEGGRSWAGARPEMRVIAYDSRGVAAHMGLLRRFIKVGEVDLLVGELGLWGVRRDLEGLGLSHSMFTMYPELQRLGVPFAFGTVRHALYKHVDRLCRGGIATILQGVRVRSTLPEVYLDLPATRIEDPLVVVFPIASSIDEWPSGTLIDRNGPEL